MIKKVLLIVLLSLSAVSLFSADLDTDLKTGEGTWKITSTSITQTDIEAPRAKIAVPYSQEGTEITYEFYVQYQGGALEDGHGGFGVHIFADEIVQGPAWGAGKSLLIWLNYDENPRDVTKGLSAQVYQSKTHSTMVLLEDIDLNWIIDELASADYTIEDVFADPIKIKIIVNTSTRKLKIADPVQEDVYYEIDLPGSVPLKGSYIVFRTNGMSASFSR